MDFRKYIPYRLVILYRWLKRSVDERVIGQGKFTFRVWIRSIYKISNALIPICALVAFGLIIYDFGFFPFYSHNKTLYAYMGYMLSIFKFLLIVRFITEWLKIKRWRAHLYNFGLVILIFYLNKVCLTITALDANARTGFLLQKLILYGGVIFLFFTEASSLLKFVYKRRQNTAFVFIISFAIIILAGTFMLMLPNATTKGITLVNALFTSASAVCVTGLTVVDTGTSFTIIGKVIILFLIQVGGLGIMTFTGLLGYLAAGSVSFHNQMALKSMVSSNRISNVITIVTRIIVVTLFFEGLGAFMLYLSMDKTLFSNNIERAFFAVFHSVSAFCNAGFSTESAGLYTESYRFNYSLQFIIALLIILGGMGFPIVFNIFSFLRIKTTSLFARITKSQAPEALTRIIQVNSRLALFTTLVLLIAGFIFFFIFEYNTSLKEHPTWMGKVVTSFFGSVTPRTAGFNTVDMTRLSMPIMMIYLLLMWIGASPSSTGGGIKTTTAAVGFLNLISVIRGRSRTEVYRTQISESSINRAFAVMLLSFVIIGFTVLLMSIYDGDKGLLRIAFEAISAFSTVGLTLGITMELSEFSKMVIVITMFIGRVGALTILLAFVNQKVEQAYRYPTEEIMY
jgi:trk system potassium uptake protein TrkH